MAPHLGPALRHEQLHQPSWRSWRSCRHCGTITSTVVPPAVLYIAASQLAQVAGLNRFVRRSEAEEAFLQRNPRLAQQLDRQVSPRFRTRVEAAVHALPAQALAEVAETQQLLPTASPAVVAAALQQDVVAPSVAKQSEADSQHRVNLLTRESPALATVAAELLADTRMQRGEAREDGALDTAAATLGQPVRERNADLHSKLWFRHCGYDVVVRGKVDGISAGRIIETKNRSRTLFGAIPEYEQVQLCAYMWLLEGDSCTHVENYDNEQINTEYDFDEELWAICERQVSLHPSHFSRP